MLTTAQRDAIYALVPLIMAVLVAYGIVTEEEAAVLGAAVLGFLGVLVAFANRPGKSEG